MLNVLVYNVILYIIKCKRYILFCEDDYGLAVFFTELFWQPQLPVFSSKNHMIFFTMYHSSDVNIAKVQC